MSLVVSKSKLIAGAFFSAFWLVTITPCILQEATHQYQASLITILTLIAEAVFVLLGIWTLRNKTDIAIIAIFLVFSYISTRIVNGESMMMYINGLRTYIGFLFIIPVIRYFHADRARWCTFVAMIDRSIYVYLWLQVPVMVYQCALYGAYDNVGGTLGWNMSGVTSTLIYLCSFYLMLRRWNPEHSFMSNLIRNKMLIFLLFPTFLNETKVSFLFLALYFLLINPFDHKMLKRLVWLLPLMAVMMGGAIFMYSQLVSNADDVTTDDFVTVYLIGNEEALDGLEEVMDRGLDPSAVFEGGDVTRGFKFFVAPAILNRSPLAPAFGYGMGQFKGGTFLERTEFTKEFFWILKGTIMQGYITMIELGWIGLGLYVLYWIVMLRFGKKCPEGRNKQLQWYLGLTIIIFSVYNNPYFLPTFYVIFSFFIFVSTCWHDLPPYRYRPLINLMHEDK